MPLVDLRGVGVRFGTVPALHDIDLRIDAGERVALLGPSGAGKSTVLGILGGRVLPTDGEATVLGADVTALAGRSGRQTRQRIGTVHQDFALTDSIRVVHNVNAGLLGKWSTLRALRSLAAPVDRAGVLAVLEKVGLADKLDTRTADLSGGERQRVAIARVLIQDPDLVLADEPAASLDPELGSLAAGLLTRLVAGPERALVMSLHDPALAEAHCDRAIGLRDGTVVFDVASSALGPALLADLYRR